MDKRVIPLINKFLEGKCSKEEEAALNHWYEAFSNESLPNEIIDPVIQKFAEERTLQQINRRIASHENRENNKACLLFSNDIFHIQQ